MKSEELNEKLSAISDEGGEYGYDALGGKAVAYIGWYWRTVDFDREDGYELGVIPEGTRNIGGDLADALEAMGVNPPSVRDKVGFMENNKWGYPYVHADAVEWANIKRLLEEVATNPNVKTLAAADAAIQALSVKPRVDD